MLKGKQKKLDKNNNGRIDGEDFKLLRADKPMKAAMGKSVRGYGAARTSGSGLMDEQMAPGKVMKAKRGSGLDLPVINKVKPAVMDKTKMANKKLLLESKDYKDYAKKRKKYSSMEEMRKAKGFRPGETASEFNKRRLKLAGAKKALGATRLGKIALGVAAAGIGAKKYLESKMNKKMGGGMMNKPMGYDQGAPKGGINVKKPSGRSFPKKTKFDTFVIIDGKTQKLPKYRTGQMVMARGCKLGRKKATKIT